MTSYNLNGVYDIGGVRGVLISVNQNFNKGSFIIELEHSNDNEVYDTHTSELIYIGKKKLIEELMAFEKDFYNNNSESYIKEVYYGRPRKELNDKKKPTIQEWLKRMQFYYNRFNYECVQNVHFQFLTHMYEK
mgnify:CR=1 FL=1